MRSTSRNRLSMVTTGGDVKPMNISSPKGELGGHHAPGSERYPRYFRERDSKDPLGPAGSDRPGTSETSLSPRRWI
jgi:hypothetical protein